MTRDEWMNVNGGVPLNEELMVVRENNAKKHAEALAALTAMDEANDLIPLSVLNAVLNGEIPHLGGWK